MHIYKGSLAFPPPIDADLFHDDDDDDAFINPIGALVGGLGPLFASAPNRGDPGGGSARFAAFIDFLALSRPLGQNGEKSHECCAGGACWLRRW